MTSGADAPFQSAEFLRTHADWKGASAPLVIFKIMKSDARWMRILAWRVFVNAFVGTVASAIAGEFCLGFAGILIAAVFSITPYPWSDKLALAGLLPGAFAGLLIFVVATIKSAPGEIIAPVRALLGRVVVGQIAGTLLVSSAFLAFAFIKSQMQMLPIAQSIGYDANILVWFAPLIMFCGAIAAALTKRDLPKTATLKAE